jgi:hypothetical protein
VKPIPSAVVSVRVGLCRKCPTPCAERESIQHNDPCASCPITPRRWGPYGRCTTYGLGDLVAAVAQPIARGIDAVAGTRVAECGGCKKRREALNQIRV